MKEINVLILTVTAGYGHISVSNALKDYLENQKIDSKKIKVDIFDILGDVNPLINKVFTEYYLKAIKYIPNVYSFLYKKEAEKALENPRKFKRSSKKLKQKIQEEEITVTDIFNKVIIKKKLMSILKKQKPNFIICTHPFIGELLELTEIYEYVKSEEGLNACILTVVTDYVVHPSWLNDASDFFIFASDRLKYFLNEVKPELLEKDEHDNVKAKFFGIPIKDSFNNTYDKIELRKNHVFLKENHDFLTDDYALGDKFTYLIMGGGYGIGNIKDYVKLLIEHENNSSINLHSSSRHNELSNILVVCGNNQELYEEILYLKKEKDYNNQIMVLGFVKNIDEIMKMSDVIITKPGGISITEAMACRLPIVIREYLPGQEERNTEFLLNNNLGIYTAEDSSFLAYLSQLKYDEDYRNQIIDNQKKIYEANDSYDENEVEDYSIDNNLSINTKSALYKIYNLMSEECFKRRDNELYKY
ncbi:putative Monogalactosyldiacylglycerol synthase [Acetoanaerobium sticklandii]|uniref:Putative Monogalactosyldiacylglycerol synthase n=1 Tax=Acetoanaerobium sticklandii (strain ATCC 12662 / DSM 519 / JCM 1433 / CCUG 9281 / NCIMB 10654 / HF) TaxID=499177 RepID=E3PWA8_ACESD|nr:glycosyltransferase [Acetoanaerobium sticklandii]CBH20723.1 putative Monogalactosyldiacylglycerol synthase [Acetoanaerobium sticklandii]